jgi:hypothetical protein
MADAGLFGIQFVQFLVRFLQPFAFEFPHQFLQ